VTVGPPTFGEALRFWWRLGWISFGGPAGQIAIMHREIVERRRWLTERRFLHALNFCMLLPGPEAMQLATYAGWLLHGTRGGLAAGVLFVLPSIFILLALSWIYAEFGATPAVAALFYGLKCAVLAIVVAATFRIGARALRHPVLYAVAAAAFAALFWGDVPFPAVIVAAGAVGLAGARVRSDIFAPAGHGGGWTAGDGGAPPADSGAPARARTARTAAAWLAIWFVPMGALLWARGAGDVLVREAVFFSQAACVTFGGAYAVLPYVAQRAVETHGWLTADEMIDGLGLAETTPGPLIMVLQFVGYLAGHRGAADLGPFWGGVAGALTATYFTFVPCFLWIFAGAPYVERTRGRPALAGALGAITAAVVGVILNLSIWFGLQVLLPGGTLDPAALAVSIGAFLLLRRGWDVMPVLGLSAAAGFAVQALG
jgi:chromate transporter